MEPTVTPMCSVHPDRVAGVRCQRCEKPICPSCMVQASVGFHCPQCAGARTTKVVSGRAAFGAAADPIATKVLIGANVAVYVLMVALGGSMSAGGPLFQNGAIFGPYIANGEWYRLVSGAFLHSSVLHLGMNMLLLWLLGKVLEPALGRAQFVGIYFVSLLGGSLGVMLLDPTAPTVGASGAIFGLMGALVVLQLRAGQSPWQSGIGTLIALNLVITFMLPNISIGGHLGGLVAGAAATYGLALAMPDRANGRAGLPPPARLVALGALGVALAVVAVVVVGTNNYVIVPG
ncbi:MAG: rhomboid family intramembrane serine protease [Microthrixaceae bacterium]|nr:rhomboid family intramembrane serine protease [Microthrixaceae bacterium]